MENLTGSFGVYVLRLCQAQVSLFHDTKVLASSSYECSNLLHERGLDHAYDLEVSRVSSDPGIEKSSANLSDDNYPDFLMPTKNRFSSFEKSGLPLINPSKRKTTKQIPHDISPDDESLRLSTDLNHSESVLESPILSSLLPYSHLKLHVAHIS
ncbi:hypothetical protein LOD99_4068 [Oopsacas minuta]|uniref:Uncharacterized protein n=1 Tax=Oopsacas minuta TaxID=111878 RepID=A0AAV7JYD3_9METZ|nr:hypothetical protein LOD99_4068 [Oopsacas minuta]